MKEWMEGNYIMRTDGLYKINGKFFNWIDIEKSYNMVNGFFNFSSADSMVNSLQGEFFPFYELSVIDVLHFGDKSKAVQFYRDLHKCSLREAFDMVGKIQEDMKHFSKNVEK